MGAALIGGMDRLKKNYIKEAKKRGVNLKIFTGKESRISKRLGSPGFVVMFTDKVSHSARKDVMAEAKKKDIPVYQFHSSGVSTLRDCLSGACEAAIA